MESQPQNPEFRINPENFRLCSMDPDQTRYKLSNLYIQLPSGARSLIFGLCLHLLPYFMLCKKRMLW